MNKNSIMFVIVVVLLGVIATQQFFILSFLNPKNYETGWDVVKGSDLLKGDSKWRLHGYTVVGSCRDFLDQEFVVQQRWHK